MIDHPGNIEQDRASETNWQAHVNDKAYEARRLEEHIRHNAPSSFRVGVVRLGAIACTVLSGSLLYGAFRNVRNGGNPATKNSMLNASLNLAGSVVSGMMADTLYTTAQSAGIARRYADLMQELNGKDGRCSGMSK